MQPCLHLDRDSGLRQGLADHKRRGGKTINSYDCQSARSTPAMKSEWNDRSILAPRRAARSTAAIKLTEAVYTCSINRRGRATRRRPRVKRTKPVAQ